MLAQMQLDQQGALSLIPHVPPVEFIKRLQASSADEYLVWALQVLGGSKN